MRGKGLQKGAGYAKWAKTLNLKQMAQTLNYLTEHGLLDYADLTAKAGEAGSCPVHAAEQSENERLALILQTICATGIRVSELKFIPAEVVRTGRAEIVNKGKRRPLFLPDKLRRMKKYLRKYKIIADAVFVTRTGKPVDRSNIWRDMKALCESAGVEPGKVFPHNLRHRFAWTYYSLEKDLSRLAEIVGHSNVSTTRIYTAESGLVHAQQVERLDLILTT